MYMYMYIVCVLSLTHSPVTEALKTGPTSPPHTATSMPISDALTWSSLSPRTLSLDSLFASREEEEEEEEADEETEREEGV